MRLHLATYAGPRGAYCAAGRGLVARRIAIQAVPDVEYRKVHTLSSTIRLCP